MWIAFALNAFFSIQWGGQYSEFEVYTTGIFEFCRQKKLLESHGPVGNTFYPSFLAYNSKVAKLILSKLPQTFTFGPMSIKKKKSFNSKELLSGVFTRKFIFTSAVNEYQLFNSIFITCSNILQAKPKMKSVSA